MAGAEQEEMTCRELIQVVTDYLDGVLPDADRVRLEVHLRECPYCDEYVAQMRQTIEALGGLPSDPLDPSTQDALLRAFRGWRSTTP